MHQKSNLKPYGIFILSCVILDLCFNPLIESTGFFIRMKIMIARFLLSNFAFFFFAITVVQAADISVTDVWARPSAGMTRTGSIFMNITNRGTTHDALLSASTSVSEKVQLHTHIYDKGVLRMRSVPRIKIKAGHTVHLKPGSLHIMLIGLQKKLKEGEIFPLTLAFEKVGPIIVQVIVRKVNTMSLKKHHMDKTHN